METVLILYMVSVFLNIRALTGIDEKTKKTESYFHGIGLLSAWLLFVPLYYILNIVLLVTGHEILDIITKISIVEEVFKLALTVAVAFFMLYFNFSGKPFTKDVTRERAYRSLLLAISVIAISICVIIAYK